MTEKTVRVAHYELPDGKMTVSEILNVDKEHFSIFNYSTTKMQEDEVSFNLVVTPQTLRFHRDDLTGTGFDIHEASTNHESKYGNVNRPLLVGQGAVILLRKECMSLIKTYNVSIEHLAFIGAMVRVIYLHVVDKSEGKGLKAGDFLDHVNEMTKTVLSYQNYLDNEIAEIGGIH